jgi:hypothetical protein
MTVFGNGMRWPDPGGDWGGSALLGTATALMCGAADYADARQRGADRSDTVENHCTSLKGTMLWPLGLASLARVIPHERAKRVSVGIYAADLVTRSGE